MKLMNCINTLCGGNIEVSKIKTGKGKGKFVSVYCRTGRSRGVAPLILILSTKKTLTFLQGIKRLLYLWIRYYLQTLLAHVPTAVNCSGVFRFLLNQLNKQGFSMFTNL